GSATRAASADHLSRVRRAVSRRSIVAGTDVRRSPTRPRVLATVGPVVADTTVFRRFRPGRVGRIETTRARRRHRKAARLALLPRQTIRPLAEGEEPAHARGGHRRLATR